LVGKKLKLIADAQVPEPVITEIAEAGIAVEACRRRCGDMLTIMSSSWRRGPVGFH
jgi:hypothetical protein